MSEATPVEVRSPVLGDPTGAAVALFTVVTLLLGLLYVGVLPAGAISLFVPVLILAGLAELFVGLLAIRKGENIIGLFFAFVGPFLTSFGLLIVGLQHNWYAIAPADIPHAQAGFLMGWTIILSLFFFLSTVLPFIFTALLTFVDIGLWLLVVGAWNSTTGVDTVAGYMLLVTSAGGLYFIASVWLGWAGAASLPLGRPLIHRSPARTRSENVPVPAAAG